MIEITRLAKVGGPLTKRISLTADGLLSSDGSACIMSEGGARRERFDALTAFASCLNSMASHEAVALGALRGNLPDIVKITTKDQLAKLNGSASPDMIARTSEHITYEPGRPALALIDYDTKGMPDAVKARIDAAGGFWPALLSVVPELAQAGRVMRRSTSSGISRSDTGEKLIGSAGVHVFVLVQDGADVERFLKTMHERCWLAGLGWMMVGAGGQLLERSIVDRMVYAPERLVFEGAPILAPPLMQDQASRRATVTDGGPIDTTAACPPLRIVDRARLAELRTKEAHRLTPERAKAREAFVAEQAQLIVQRANVSPEVARRIVERQCEGVLLSGVVLPFDAAEMAGCNVADVLANPDRFVGATLADPLEGVSYGRCKAKIMRRPDGSLWINSFAHGRVVYEIKQDVSTIEEIVRKAPDNEAVGVFARLASLGDLESHDRERLRDAISQRTGTNKRTIDQALKKAQQARTEQQEQQHREQAAAGRTDPRPLIPAPTSDAPWIPQMEVLNDVLGRSTAPEPPMRDVEGFVTVVQVRPIPSMHALTARGANESDTDDSRLPAPDYPLLTRLGDCALAELIEGHIDYVDAEGRSVHLAAPFVKHFLNRADGVLPVVTAVATLPMVLPDGAILSGRGLERARGIVFRVAPELEALLPRRDECTPSAVAEAMRFLTDEFLCDVAADYTARCVLIAIAATVLERLLLPERPAFFIPAGQRGGGKTTTANMIAMAALGRRAAAAAWSPNDEERRKALLAYLGEGVPLICWDNIPRGAVISCPSIERALTAETYTDRVLGVTETRTVPATAVHVFTGNNIGPRGDLASRSLIARLSVDRPDPENRVFRHPDPLGWTEANRGRILRAIYTILLGNPRLRAGTHPPAETRFKAWWHLVGSAIEHGARQHFEHVQALTMDADGTCRPTGISFKAMFLGGEADEEQTSSLATVLDVMRTRWPDGFKASEVAHYAGSADAEALEFRAALEQASGKAIKVMTSTVVTWRLKAIMDAPVLIGGTIWVLRYWPNAAGDGGEFKVAAAAA